MSNNKLAQYPNYYLQRDFKAYRNYIYAGIYQGWVRVLEDFALMAFMFVMYFYFCLGIIYQDGIGVEENETKAFEYFKKSAEKGYDKAQMRSEERRVGKECRSRW